MIHARIFASVTAAALAAAMLTCASFVPATAAAKTRTQLTFAYLQQGQHVHEVDMSAFALPATAHAPSNRFQGTLQVSGAPRTRTIRLMRGFLTPAQVASARTFPDFNFAFVQDGNVLLPVHRGYIVTRNPHWDVVLEPGRIWDEPGDHGFTRAAIPFALIQKHMNCTHYGVLTFLFKQNGSISHVAMQISSETCKYFKIDMWGRFKARYDPHPVASRQAVIAAYRNNQAHRLPERPVRQLATDFPGVDPSRLVIGEGNSRTMYGLVVNGINYVSACPTRRGNYPYCDELPFPSYSLAKSVEAGLALMAMQQAHPGTAALTVSQFAPVSGCGKPGWRDVTFRNLLDMTSGHYDSKHYMVDEDADKVGRFFGATTEHQKATFACDAYPRQARPGTTWVYHTSDTFLLGDVLNGYLRSLPGRSDADIFRDVVVAKIYRPLDLSATAFTTRRTAYHARQPFFGYGLQFNRDDIARLAEFIGKAGGKVHGKQVLDPKLLNLALQRAPGHRGSVVKQHPMFRYQLGFWARNIAPMLGCANPTWVPFMSGYGAISIVIYPNGAVYYNVSDAGSAEAFDWSPSAPVARRVGGDFCH